ncbi:hypothetical protein ALC53_07084, partial [Atta colombica]
IIPFCKYLVTRRVIFVARQADVCSASILSAVETRDVLGIPRKSPSPVHSLSRTSPPNKGINFRLSYALVVV